MNEKDTQTHVLHTMLMNQARTKTTSCRNLAIFVEVIAHTITPITCISIVLAKVPLYVYVAECSYPAYSFMATSTKKEKNNRHTQNISLQIWSLFRTRTHTLNGQLAYGFHFCYCKYPMWYLIFSVPVMYSEQINKIQQNSKKHEQILWCWEKVSQPFQDIYCISYPCLSISYRRWTPSHSVVRTVYHNKLDIYHRFGAMALVLSHGDDNSDNEQSVGETPQKYNSIFE